ncbi:universal stress protein [Flexivirga endophytica]|uniref:Universal stress protein n=1 Tax=Flexivirga endophytica TaxID=1849103 RepID=A0A916SUB2_9MICO|nr:universal stress protein [Flexivirga endophytica]GGB18351.1 universal stress protein [Flexivirga endophytica]GHB37297.1 universal stress protein [Flexivirga endophytica]
MEGSVQPGSIVVGIDTSTCSMTALDWAADYAHATHAPVHLVHGFSHDRPDLVFNMGAEPDKLYAAGERVLTRGRNRVLLKDARLAITTAHPDGYPAAALVRASAHARLVVIGSHGDSMLHISSLGETAHQVAAHARCPVAVIRKESDSAYGRITAGVDRSAHSRKALAWAFAEAERTQADLQVVHVWQPDDAKDPGLGSVDWKSYMATARSQIEASIADQQRQHPGVKVLTDLVDGNPTRVLVDKSHESDLVVVGARGIGGFEGLTLGRVAVDLLSHATSPVLIMH